MRIIDIHTHVFPEKIAKRALTKLQAGSHTLPFSDGTAEGLRASMNRAGVDLSVVLPVATAAGQVAHINDRAIQMHRDAEKTGIDSFGAAHPDDPDWKRELEKLKEAGIKGIKIHPPYQEVNLDDIRYLRILDRAGELGLTVVTHAGLDVGLPGAEHATPEKIRRAVDAAGPVRLICAHMGGWKCWNEACELLTDTGIRLDTSFSLGMMTPNGDGYPWRKTELERMSEEDFCHMVRLFGADRILFGTDSPWEDQADSVKGFCGLPLSEEEKAAILGGNAEKLFGTI